MDREFYRGDEYQFEVFVVDGKGARINLQVLAGLKVWFSAKRAHAQPDSLAVIALTNSSSAIAVGASGKLTITIPPLATFGFPDAPDTLIYDIQYRHDSGGPYTVEAGNLTVKPDVTRAIQ